MAQQQHHRWRRLRAEEERQQRRRHGLLILALLLLGGASIAGVEAQPASLQVQVNKGGLRGAAGLTAIDAASVRREEPSAATSNGSRSGARARAEDALLTVLSGPLTPTQFSRLEFPIPKTLRAREALRLDGDGFSEVRELPMAKVGKKDTADRRWNSSMAAMGAVGRQQHEVVVDRYEDAPDGACNPASDVVEAGADEKKSQTATPLHPTCNLRAALRWAAEWHRRGRQEDGEEAAVVTIYLPTRWPHLLTLGELSVAEKGCVRESNES